MGDPSDGQYLKSLEGQEARDTIAALTRLSEQGPVEVGEVHLMDPKAPGDTIGYVDLAQRANDQCGAVASGDERVLGAVPE